MILTYEWNKWGHFFIQVWKKRQMRGIETDEGGPEKQFILVNLALALVFQKLNLFMYTYIKRDLRAWNLTLTVSANITSENVVCSSHLLQIFANSIG